MKIKNNFLKTAALIILFGGSTSVWAQRPKLIVMVAGDQIRADYMDRLRDKLLPDGLRRFVEQGAYFSNARQDTAMTKTSPGHVLYGSGLYPRQSGVIGNEWFDRTSDRMVIPAETIPGGDRVQLKWFIGDSFAQRLHRKSPQSRVVSVSLKDRGALLMTGPDQDDAYWWDRKTQAFTSYKSLSPWLGEFQSTNAIMKTTMADTITEQLAERIVDEWKLGDNPAGATDVLTVSFSAVDLIGHEFGPDAIETHQAFFNLDRAVSKLMAFIEKKVGKEVVWVFSSDHGVTPMPEISKANGLDAGRVLINEQILKPLGTVKKVSIPYVYLDEGAVRAQNKTISRAVEELRALLMKIPGVQAAYVTQDILTSAAPQDVINSIYTPEKNQAPRGGEVFIVLNPNYIFSEPDYRGTTHGQPTDDDQRVPLGFYGMGIAPKTEATPTSVSVVAPTLLKKLGVAVNDLSLPMDVFQP